MTRGRRLIPAIAVAVAMMVALPGSASHPPVVVASMAGWAPAVLTVSSGDTVSFGALDFTHSFVTDAAICRDPLGAAVPCDIIIGVRVPVGVSATARIHASAAKGIYQFRCGFHTWMLGVVVIN